MTTDTLENGYYWVRFRGAPLIASHEDGEWKIFDIFQYPNEVFEIIEKIKEP